MRSILLHIHDDECLEARLQAAFDLAHAFDGHLTCAQSVPIEIAVPGDFDGMVAAQLIPELRDRADELREKIEQRLQTEGVAWDWQRSTAPADTQLLQHAGLSDVIVLGSEERSLTRGPAPLISDIVLHARTPVLVVPKSLRKFDCNGSALVAWDGSSEASRALRSAVPLLAKAGKVTLAAVVGEDKVSETDLPPTEGAEYLSRHDIGCEMVELPLNGGSIAETLAAAATARGATYIVTGAYGRPRLLETIWGGVTREFLSRPPLPVLACH